MIKVDVKDLNTVYVVCKRQRGQHFFVYHSRQVTTTSATSANRYTDKAQAEAVALEWKTKQKCRFKVEPLSKFLVNDFTVNYYSYNDKIEDKISISSRPLSVDAVSKYKRNFSSSIEHRKKDILNNIEGDIQNKKNYIAGKDKALADAQARYEERIAYANKELLDSRVQISTDVANATAKIEEFTKFKEQVSEVNFDNLIEPFKTKTDSNMQVLFGKKHEENTLTTQDGVSTMILLGRKP